MKRDLDLIRYILLRCEEITPNPVYVEDLTTDKVDFDTISYHIELLFDSGYIVAEPISGLGHLTNDFIIYRLTSDGHDYLDSVRDNQVYKSVKKELGKVATSAPLEIVKSIGLSILKSQLNI